MGGRGPVLRRMQGGRFTTKAIPKSPRGTYAKAVANNKG